VGDPIALAISWALTYWPHLRADTKLAYPTVDAETALREIYASYSSETLGRRADIELPTKMRPVCRAAFDVLDLLRDNGELGRLRMFSITGLPVAGCDFEGGQIGTAPPGRMFLFRRRGSPLEIGRIIEQGATLPRRRKIPRRVLTALVHQYHDFCNRVVRDPSVVDLAGRVGVSRGVVQTAWVRAGYSLPSYGGKRRG
jgi:hypothetical protein